MNVTELPSGKACQDCRRVLMVGDTAYASDWYVIEPEGGRWQTRYTCVDCEAKA